MKLTLATVLLSVSLSSLVSAAEIPRDEARHARYESGEVMAANMARKEGAWKRAGQRGLFNPRKFRSSNKHTACKNGRVEFKINGTTNSFQCNNLDVTGHLTHGDLGSADASDEVGSSIWGYTVDGREFIAIGQTDGTAFAEVVGKGWWNWIPLIGKAEGTLDYIGRLPVQQVNSIWREIRDYKGRYAIIGSEGVGSGIQIFDIRKLLEVRPSWNRLSTATKVFSTTNDISFFGGLPTGRSHNVVSAAASNHIIAVGAAPRNSACRGGLIFIDVSDINNPKQTGCAAQDGYVHDAQCLIYRGPDKKYEGREICYGYNEDALTIYDITDKTNATIISITSYEGATYTHQGWVLDENDQRYLLLDDEIDELDRVGPAADQRATTYIFDIQSLEAPKQTGTFKSPSIAIDHNQYIKNYFSYQAQYGAGLRILDVASVPRDPTGAGIKEVAFLDIFPEDDNAVSDPDFLGTWHNYPFFKSGHIVLNTFDRGVFVAKRSARVTGGVRAEF